MSIAYRRVFAGLAFLVAAGVWIAGCSGDQVGPPPPPVPPPPPGPPVASDPVSPAPLGSSGSASVMIGTADEDVAFVALPPGSAPDGRIATIRNLRTNDSVVVSVGAGGFDPAAIPAIVGDQIAIIVRDAAGNVVFQPPVLVVAARRPPVVVRTNPPPRKRDVPLSSRMTVVFSEPIDSATLDNSSVQLRRGAQLVAGRLEFRDSLHVAAVFIPDEPLAPSATYTLDVTRQIRDLDGDMLDSAVTVEFTTATSGGYEEFFVEGVQGRFEQWANDSVRGEGDSVLVLQDVIVVDGSGTGIEGAVLRFRVSTGFVQPEITTSGLGGLASLRWIFDGVVGRPPSDSTAELSACASNSATRCDMYWPILLLGYNPR